MIEIENGPILLLVKKYLQKRFPFILDITSIELTKDESILRAYVTVSSSHFCEMYFSGKDYGEIVEVYVSNNSSDIFKSIIPEWAEKRLTVVFFPKIDKEDSIVNYIPKEKPKSIWKLK
jgi:hypothetical protein